MTLCGHSREWSEQQTWLQRKAPRKKTISYPLLHCHSRNRNRQNDWDNLVWNLGKLGTLSACQPYLKSRCWLQRAHTLRHWSSSSQGHGMSLISMLNNAPAVGSGLDAKQLTAESTEDADIKWLSFKTAFLLAIITARWICKMHVLSVRTQCLHWGPKSNYIMSCIPAKDIVVY